MGFSILFTPIVDNFTVFDKILWFWIKLGSNYIIDINYLNIDQGMRKLVRIFFLPSDLLISDEVEFLF